MGELKKIVCVGDSITEGFGLRPEEAYPVLLQEMVPEGYEVFNKGVTGSCVTNTTLNGETVGMPYVRQDRYKEALELCGDIYIVMLGTNDGQDGMHDTLEQQEARNNIISYKDDFISYYMAILDSIRKANKEAKIYIVKPVPVMRCIWRKHQQKYMDLLLPKIEQIATEHPELELIDVFQAYMDMDEKSRAQYYLEDGLHPNAEGAKIITRVIGQAVFGTL